MNFSENNKTVDNITFNAPRIITENIKGIKAQSIKQVYTLN
jgi:hypothetical protein